MAGSVRPLVRWALAASILGAVFTALGLRAQTPPTTPRPAFRAGTNVVELDVSVLDDQRQPVRGLTAADFSVRQDDVPQPIVAFEPIDVPGAVEPTATWMKTAGSDLTSNDANAQRLS